MEAAEAIRKRVEALASEGRRTELDLERARLQAARARQKVLNAESDRDLDVLELKRLIGWPGSTPLTLAGDPDGIGSRAVPVGEPLRRARDGPGAEVALRARSSSWAVPRGSRASASRRSSRRPPSTSAWPSSTTTTSTT